MPVLGAETMEAYNNGFNASAAVIGRVANRIAKARFTLDGKDYKLAANNGPNHLHGGVERFFVLFPALGGERRGCREQVGILVGDVAQA